MNFGKGLLCTALSLLMTAQLTVSAFAQSAEGVSADSENTPIAEQSYTAQQTVTEVNSGLSGQSEQIVTDDTIDPDYMHNDPSYQKYLFNQTSGISMASLSLSGLSAVNPLISAVAAVSGADKLVHQARFENVPKCYGIDISYYQGDIDWKKVKESGVEFVIVRIGYRGYGSSGTLVQDKNLYTYLDGAIAQGLDVGCYFYTQAINTTEAKQEAQYCINKIKNYDLDLPIYYDIEGVDYDVGRLDSANLSKAQKTKLCEAFCDTIIASGYESGVYSNKSWLTYQVDGAALDDKYDIWLAHYTTETDYTGDFCMWQFTGKGSINGITGYVDTNVMYLDNCPASAPVVSCTKLNDKTCQLSWEKVENSTGYAIYRRDSAGKETLLKKQTGLTYNITLSDTEYTYYVKAYNVANKVTYFSDSSNEFTLSNKKVMNLQATSASANAVALTWDSLAGCSGYVVSYRTVGGDFQQYTAVNTNSCTVKGLSPTTVYEFKVNAYQNADDTAKFTSASVLWSDSDIISKPTLPSQVTGFTITESGNNYIKVKWNKCNDNIVGYQVVEHFPETNTNKSLLITTSTSGTISGLSEGVHTFAVRAYYKTDTENIKGKYSTKASTYVGLAKPTGITASNLTTNSADIKWDKLANCTGYYLYLYQDGKLVSTYTAKTNSQKLTELSSESKYTVKIQAFKDVDDKTYSGPKSNEYGFTLGMQAPVLKAGSTYTDSSTSIQWESVPGATMYIIESYSGGKYYFERTAAATTTSLTFTKLTANKGYTYRIKPVYGSVVGPASKNITVYTKPTPPANFKCTAKTKNSMSFSWSKVSGATSYKIYKYDPTTKKYKAYAETTSTSFKATGLSANTTYYFYVTAVRKTDLKTYQSAKSDTVKLATSK